MSNENDENIFFDKYVLEKELQNDMKKICKIKENLSFALLLKKYDKNNNIKYYADVKNKNEHYIGVLTKNFKKELFGYILLKNGDEYLGQLKEEKKEGFGVYKYISDKNDGQDIYIGHFSNDVINGEGIYINIIQSEIKDNSLLLITCNCHIGLFKDGKFIKGKTYMKDKECEKIEFQEDEETELEILLKSQKKEIINYEKKNNIYIYNKGIMQEKRLIEGFVITVKEKKKDKDKEKDKDKDKENYEFENKFKYNIQDDLQYKYEYLEDEKKTEELLTEFKNSNYKNYKDIIQNLLKSIDEMIDRIKKDFDYGRSLNFENFEDNFVEDYKILIDKYQ